MALRTSRAISARSSRESSGLGTGSAYIRARLRERFGADWTLDDGPTDAGGWRSTLTIPALNPQPEFQPRLALTPQPDP